MSLLPGTRIGPYQVVGPLGAGGMGEVYRARDTNLGRDVAPKILPDAFAGDPDRLMRFEREARTLAALNHPHIAQIHGLEEANGTRALVMELVQGEDASPAAAATENSPTITSPAMTRAGMILGTAAYMAPEQARGKQVDKRADIWAFGVVFYEMLSDADRSAATA